MKQCYFFTESFRKFDYGTSKNLKIYGSTQPPKYCLERVKVPVAVFYSENDFLTHPTDVQRLVENMPNVALKHKIEYSKFNHIDYLWGRDVKTLLYDHITEFIKKYDWINISKLICTRLTEVYFIIYTIYSEKCVYFSQSQKITIHLIEYLLEFAESSN